MLDTDACDKQVGCVPLQEQPEGPVKPVGYCSKSLNKAEQACDTAQRECFAVVWAVLILKPYLKELQFTV